MGAKKDTETVRFIKAMAVMVVGWLLGILVFYGFLKLF